MNPKSHHTYSSVGDILVPSRGIRDDLRRQGLTPKDHTKDNRAHIAKLKEEREAKERKDAAEKERKKPHQPGALPSYLADRKKIIAREIETDTANSRSPGVTGGLTNRTARPLSSSTKKLPSRDAVAKKLEPKHKAGAVPKYVNKFKAQAQAEAIHRAEEERHRAECPPGMVIMPPDQQKAILAAMMKDKAEAEKALAAFPMIADTESLRRRKGEVEKRLDALERDISVMSRPKVFIKM